MAVREVDRARLGWWLLAVAFAAVLGYVVYSFIGTFVFGIFIYYATRPVYRRLKTRTRHKNVAAAVSLFALALPALLLLAYTVAVGLSELNNFLATRNVSLGQFETLLSPYFDVSAAVEHPQSLIEEPTIRGALWAIVGDLKKYLGFIGNAALHLFVMMTLAFYLLRDDARLGRWFRQRFSDDEGIVEAYTRVVDHDFSNIFFGNILNAAFTAIIGALAYSAVDAIAPAATGVPYPVLLGLLTGVASLIPIVGMKLVYVPAGIYIGVQTASTPDLLWFPVLFVAVSFFVVDVVPDLVLRPYVSGRGLHLGMVMLAYVFGPLLFGWYGIFLGPMILVLFVHFVRLVLPELLAGEPIQPDAVGHAFFLADTSSGEGTDDAGADATTSTDVDAGEN